MLLLVIFALGYGAIVLEHPLKVNKSATALLTGVLCWTVHALHDHGALGRLEHSVGEVAGILFFLLGAMTIVELVDAHDGFELITARVRTAHRRKLLVVVAVLAFFFSAVLDNLTTSIVMASLVRKLMKDERDRMIYAGVVVIAANAGGAWSPIGDVTTTMLWIGGQISTSQTVTRLFIPSVVSVAVPLLWIARRMRGSVERTTPEASAPPDVSTSSDGEPKATTSGERLIVFISGVAVLLFVPVFKTITHLPPMMGILLGLGVLWTLTELLHKSKPAEGRGALSVAGALQRVDTPSVLFFLGILLAVGALQSAGILPRLAGMLDRGIGNVDLITLAIGLASSVVDNVPLVAGAQGMYPLSSFPADHRFWLFLAYCAGTGGSILIIGSAAGVAVMGIQRITFGWYVRHFSFPAILGYLAGAATFVVLEWLRAG